MSGAQQLSDRITVCTSSAHRFGTDAFLLADFARPRQGELVCDLGTGCGIIPLIWAMRAKPVPAGVWGVELQPEAVALFQESVRRSQLPFSVCPVEADLRQWAQPGRALPEQPPAGMLHLVCCNPPYFAEHTGGISRAQAHRTARHEGSCTLEQVCRASFRLLRYGGRLAICLRPQRLAEAMTSFTEAGITPKRLRFVAKEADTPPWLFLLEGKKGGHPGLQVLPQLNLYRAGKPTPELEALYR